MLLHHQIAQINGIISHAGIIYPHTIEKRLAIAWNSQYRR